MVIITINFQSTRMLTDNLGKFLK